MNTIKRITKNTAVMLGANLISKIFTFFYLMYIARFLGAEGYGLFSFAFGFTGIFIIFTDLGLETLAVREVARDRSLAGKYLGNFITMKLGLSLLTFGLIAGICGVLHYSPASVRIIYLMTLHIILRAFSNLFYSIFKAFERMEFISIGALLGNGLTLLGVGLAIWQKFSVMGIAWVYVAVSAVDVLFAGWICLWKFARPKFEADWPFWKSSVAKAWPIGAMTIFTMIYFRIDTVMIDMMKGNPHVGLYGAAYRLAEIMTIIPSIFMVSIFPVLSTFYQVANDSFKRAYALSTRYLFYLALPIALAGTILARPIVALVYGKEYMDAVPAFQILLWASAIMFVTMVQGTTFVASNKQLVNMVLSALSVVLNIGLNLLVIPKYSYVGASMATVVTELFGLLTGLYFLNRWGFKLRFTQTWLVPLAGLLAAGAIAAPLLMWKTSAVVVAVLACLVYSGVVFSLGFKKEDRQLLKFVFSR
jgi:O-antigen/teichoic acid export membrane protein